MGDMIVRRIRPDASRGLRRSPLVALGAIAFLLSVLVGLAPTPAGAAELPDGPGTITVDQGPVGPTGICLPSFFALTHSVREDATSFVLTITASPSLCEPVPASAVIYAMPTDGSAWPQQLALKQSFTVPGPGMTTVTFHKGCLPAQYDVVTGATPQVISPTGAWHGPLLFPFALDSSLQFFGGGCTGNACDSYTPTNLTVDPTSVAPGGTVTVAGNGTPGTTIDILLRQPPATAVPTGASVKVGPNGQWSVPVTIPANIAPGSWQVVAKVEDCETSATADITVTGGSSGTTTTTISSTTTTSTTVVGGTGGTTDVDAATTVAPLPAAAVEGSTVSRSGTGVASQDAQAAGLAFTGSSVRLPVLVGIGLLVAGTLLLLQRRRRG